MDIPHEGLTQQQLAKKLKVFPTYHLWTYLTKRKGQQYKCCPTTVSDLSFMDIPHEEKGNQKEREMIQGFRPIIYGHTSRSLVSNKGNWMLYMFPTYHLWTYLTKR